MDLLYPDGLLAKFPWLNVSDVSLGSYGASKKTYSTHFSNKRSFNHTLIDHSSIIIPWADKDMHVP